MKGLIERLLLLLRHRGVAGSVALQGFLDSLVQSFENYRPGLSDAQVAAGGPPVESFFVEVYEKESSRLAAALRLQAPYLEGAARERFVEEVDTLVRRVVIPGYVRLALRYTPAERNDFHLLPEGRHGVERVLWALAGMLLGAVAIEVPFIPIWAREWVLVFGIGGFLLPNLRRLLRVRGYEAELNALVRRADAELGRIDMAYLASGAAARVAPERGQEREPEPIPFPPRGKQMKEGG